jgi:hypothetical protein
MISGSPEQHRPAISYAFGRPWSLLVGAPPPGRPARRGSAGPTLAPRPPPPDRPAHGHARRRSRPAPGSAPPPHAGPQASDSGPDRNYTTPAPPRRVTNSAPSRCPAGTAGPGIALAAAAVGRVGGRFVCGRSGSTPASRSRSRAAALNAAQSPPLLSVSASGGDRVGPHPAEAAPCRRLGRGGHPGHDLQRHQRGGVDRSGG